MQSASIIGFLALLAVAHCSVSLIPTTTLYRAPEHDSALIQSERVGGAFSYSTLEGHAYKAITPVVQEVLSPVSVKYSVPVQQVLVQHPYYVQQPYYASHAFYPAYYPQIELARPVEFPQKDVEGVSSESDAKALDDDSEAVDSA